jgi:zinc transporter, ZIP family
LRLSARHVLVLSALLPIALFGLLLLLVAGTISGLSLGSPAPVEQLTVERLVLEPGVIVAHVRNTGPSDVTVAQVSVNDSIWPATASPSNSVPRLGTATVTLRYPWVEGEAYHLAFFTSGAVVFRASIPVAVQTPTADAGTLWRFGLIGVYVGLLPIAAGLLWLPALRQLGPSATLFLLAVTTGVLVVLGIDTLSEALAQSSRVPGPFQGEVLVGMGVVTTVLVLTAVGLRSEKPGEAPPPLRVAYQIAAGIGLHNLGEGLAIGAAYSVGEIALGAFLVIGFMLQNLTEGVAIVVPLVREQLRPWHLVALGVIAGAPAIVGTWLGAFTYASVLATLFLAIGAGAIFQVLWVLGQAIVPRARRAPGVAVAGVMVGMLLLYVTGVLVK